MEISTLPEVAARIPRHSASVNQAMLVVLLPKGEYDAARQAAAVLEGGARMTVQRKRMERATGIVLGAVAFLILAACSSHEPKPMAQPTPDQVRGHADQNFDKLKQEERERGAQPASPQ
jgi:hypothetical protein